MDRTAVEKMSGMFTDLGTEEKRQLEAKLQCLNGQLVELNEKINQLVFQRDRLELHMRHVARELHRHQAADVKRAYDTFERSV